MTNFACVQLIFDDGHTETYVEPTELKHGKYESTAKCDVWKDVFSTKEEANECMEQIKGL